VARCPCAGGVAAEDYAGLVRLVVEGLSDRPASLLGPLRDRMDDLARRRRFEEAALVRDRAGALAAVLRRQRRLDTLRAAGRLRLRLPDGTVVELDGGVYLGPHGREGARADGATQDPLPFDVAPDGRQAPAPPGRDLSFEIATVAGWLDREAHRVRLEECEGTLASVWPALPSFEAGPSRPVRPVVAA
jgi:DNA polymerase-3 subunit epsilon